MKGYSRRLAALVFAVTAGGVAWGLTISYDDTNDEGAAYTGGKTITLDYTGASSAPLESEVWFHTSRVIDVGGSVGVIGTDSGTIDIVVPPQGALPSPLLIAVSPTLDPIESNVLSFTYWPRPLIIDDPLLGDMQHKWVGGYIAINVAGLPEPENPLGGTTLKYGRTLTVEFGAGILPTEAVFVYGTGAKLLVKVPAGTIGTSANLIVTVDDGTVDEMEAYEHPTFTWCPENATLVTVNPSEGPLAGSGGDLVYMTLTGSRFYEGYTYVSFNDMYGPWVPPADITFDSTTTLRCPLPPQPDGLEIRPFIMVKNGYEDSFGHMQDSGPNGGQYAFVYKDQPPSPVLVTGGLDGAVVDGSILLQAEAVDDRAIVQVAFYYSTTGAVPDPQTEWLNPGSYNLLGVDTTWPYELSWDTTLFTDGDHHIIAVAVDDHVWTTIVPQLGNYPDQEEIYNATGGNIVASGEVTVTVDNDNSTGLVDNPPQAQMLAPADGAVLSVDSGVITLSAMVADYEGLLDAASTVVFRVVDGNGKFWSGPLGLSWLSYLYTDPATTLDWYFATVTWDGKFWDAGAGAFVKAADGTYQITVEVWDTLSQSATDGVTVTVDSSAVCITSITPDGIDALAGSDLAGADADPTSGAYHDPLTVTITGDGFVDGGTTVSFAGVPSTSVTWVSATELTVVVPNIELPLSAADGPIDVSVTVAGVTQTLSNAFYVEDSDPYVEFLGPQAGATVGGLVLLQADARDDSAIASVTYQWSADDTNWNNIATVDAATVNYPFSYELDTTVAPFGAGTFYFRALATDDGGNVLPEPEATSVAFNLDQSTYDNPPRVTIDLPAQGVTLSGRSVVLQATVIDLEAAEPDGIGPAAFEIVSAGRNEILGTIVVDPGSVTWVTTDTWIMSATWDTTVTEMTGTVTFNQTSTAVDGTSTRFLSEFQAGDLIGESADGPWYAVASVVDNITLNLVANFTDPTVSVTPYRSGRGGGGRPLYPDGSFYVIRAAATDDAPSSNVGYGAVNVTVYNAVPVIPPVVIPPGGGGGGGGGCAPGDTAAPAAIFLLLGTVFLVFRRRRPAPA